MAALLFSSLINAILFFRIIEVAYFRAAPSEDFEGHAVADEKYKEAPASMVVPLLIVAASLLAIGIFTNEIVTNIIIIIQSMAPVITNPSEFKEIHKPIEFFISYLFCVLYPVNLNLTCEWLYSV